MGRWAWWPRPCTVCAALILQLLYSAGCRPAPAPSHTLIPVPATIEVIDAAPFVFNDSTRIVYDADSPGAEHVARFLSDLIGNTVETMPTVEPVAAGAPLTNVVHMRYSVGPQQGNDAGEGYRLRVTAEQIELEGDGVAGLFYGAATIRQLLPALVEYTAAYPNPLAVPAVSISDSPRFEWRGAMLDVSRHFLPAGDVKRFIDLMAIYKLNRLHLHLADDQGWRIEIPGRPLLTEIGSSTQVGGKGGGYYSTDQYRDIVQYAADRFITIVPEIDLPGHTNAALASYAELNCDNRARSTYTGTSVGFSSVCVEREETYEFIDDVIRELAAMTPGRYIHVGGDEVETLTEEQYVMFVDRVEEIVARHDKLIVGWDEVAAADLSSGSRVQLWRPLWPAGGDTATLDSARAAAASVLRQRVDRAVANGVSFIVSPADRIYLDMKYTPTTTLGLTWAGVNDVRDAYEWDISDVFSGIPESAIAGVEAPLWSESLGSIHDFEYMAFPRLPGVAELGWSPADTRDWQDYRQRLAGHELRWKVMGVNYHRSRLVPWSD